jgi:hypothetical protein
MKTVEEIRRERLSQLLKKYRNMADFCEAMGYPRTQTARFSRILNANPRHDRDGQAYVMGSALAREIEQRIGLDVGWLDNLQTYAEILGPDDQRAKILQLMEAMPTDQWATVLRLVDAVAQPALKTGTQDAE